MQEGKLLFSFQSLETCTCFAFLNQNFVRVEREVKFDKY